MKMPAPPPDLDKLVREAAESDRLVPILGTRANSRMAGEYLAWDRMRFKTPPEDMTAEEWWLATRLARKGVERPIELLRDVNDVPFNYVLPDLLLEAIEYINANASGQISISEQVTNPATRDRYIVSSLIEEAITSSQLEGAMTTRQVAKEMIRTGRDPKDRSERMIFNNYAAMRRISELRDRALTPDLICEMHRIVTDGTLDNPDAAGRIQGPDAERIIVGDFYGETFHRPPPAEELPERMERLCRFANGEGTEGYMPPVLRALSLHFMMGYDHYFEDGNGRTARVLFYWSMLRHGYWLVEFVPISRILKKAPAKYGRSFLLTEQDGGDLTHFFVYHVEVIRRAIKELHDYLGRKARELKDLQQTIKAMPGEYNYRQLALLQHAAEGGGGTFTVQTHSTSHNTSIETARQDLTDLERRGLLVRSRVGKRLAWTPVPDILGKLKG
jgi:Fic family protein